MIVVSPTHDWIKAALHDCSSSFVVSSPYVGNYLQAAVLRLPERISVSLLTRTVLADFASYASDLDAVQQIAQRSGGVLSLSSLHAKVYIIDCKKALVTSANATYSGMHRNRECGFEVMAAQEVCQLTELVYTGFGATPKPQRWTATDLEALREPVKTLRAALPRVHKQRKVAIEEPPRVNLPRRQFYRLLDTLPGWTRLTLEGISRIKPDVFTMDQVWSVCVPLAATRFPNNQHVREKLRQQMQRLRDLGLVLFLGKGRYERLASTGI